MTAPAPAGSTASNTRKEKPMTERDEAIKALANELRAYADALDDRPEAMRGGG